MLPHEEVIELYSSKIDKLKSDKKRPSRVLSLLRRDDSQTGGRVE